jgi:hypothetical protein
MMAWTPCDVHGDEHLGIDCPDLYSRGLDERTRLRIHAREAHGAALEMSDSQVLEWHHRDHKVGGRWQHSEDDLYLYIDEEGGY